jgi:hypothetical protein
MAISIRQTYAIDVADVDYLWHGDKPLLARLYRPQGEALCRKRRR